ncbi:MAG: nitrilase-related carbon-nitrogen hydrolase [Lysobacter sp.]
MNNTRRDFLTGAAAGVATLGALGTGILSSGTAHAAPGTLATTLTQNTDGTYATVPLEKDSWNLGLIQSRVHTFDLSNVKAGMKRNLDAMLKLIDKACYLGPKKDMLFLHEFPLTGWDKWNKKDVQRLSIELPGPESDEIAKKARQYDTWIVFGAYVRDPDWPGHVLSITTMMNNKGEIVAKHWKSRNIKGAFEGWELFTTTVFDVLDQYTEMYGRDAVIPIARTPLGNMMMSSTQREPELFRAAAMKGAEVFLRTATGGFFPIDMAATSLYNGTYTAVVNNSISPDNGLFFDDSTGYTGGSAVYEPSGAILAEAQSKHDTLVVGRIKIAELRAQKRQPVIHMEMYKDIFDRYQSPYAPNMWSKYVPTSLDDAARYVNGTSRWK